MKDLPLPSTAPEVLDCYRIHSILLVQWRPTSAPQRPSNQAGFRRLQFAGCGSRKHEISNMFSSLQTLAEACLRGRKEEAEGDPEKECRKHDEVGDFRVGLT